MINRASLAEQAYAAIKDMILRLELLPGAPVTEAQLAALLKISKSPVRSALIHLQRDGLVEITPYKETIVARPSVAQVRHVFEARILIEPHVVAQVTPGLTPADHELLETMLRRAEAALRAGDVRGFFAVNTEFHGYFFQRHPNDFFRAALQTVDLQMERLRMISATIPDHPGQQHAEHTAIFDAVRAGAAVAAGQAMRAHIAGYRDDVLAEIEAGRISWLRPRSAPAEEAPGT